jgi:tetratricopeptide (TPR) repeat protein
MRILLLVTLFAGVLAISAPVQAQKIDPLTGEIVEQAPPPEPVVADLTEAHEKVKAQDYAGAESLLAALQVEFPEDERVLALRGELLVALGRIDEALPILRKVVEMAPERPRVHFQLGTALASSGDKAGAIDAFGKELEHSKENQVRLLAHMNRSMLYQQQREWGPAAAELENALELDPSRPELWADLVTLHLDAKDLDGAMQALRDGSEAGHRSARHYYSVGARLFKAERFADARDAMAEVLEIEPTHARAVRSLAASMEKLGEEEEALEQWARYLELAPQASDADQVTQKLKSAGKR